MSTKSGRCLKNRALNASRPAAKPSGAVAEGHGLRNPVGGLPTWCARLSSGLGLREVRGVRRNEFGAAVWLVDVGAIVRGQWWGGEA